MKNITDKEGYLTYKNERVTCLAHARNIVMKELSKHGYQFHDKKHAKLLSWVTKTHGGYCDIDTNFIVKLRRSLSTGQIGIIQWGITTEGYIYIYCCTCFFYSYYHYLILLSIIINKKN